MESRKQFSKIETVDELNAVNDAQKAIFAEMVRASGGTLDEQRQSAYLARWREALVYVPRKARVLDIGGGWPIERIWQAIVAEHGIDYHYLDIDNGIIASARDFLSRYGLPVENAQPGPNTVVPFGDAAFDFVFSSHCLEHSADLSMTFREIQRVLKPSGLIFFAVPLGFDDSDEHLLYLDVEDWLDATEMSGFEVINYHLGQTYPMNAWDLCVVARPRPEKANPQGLRDLVFRHSKMDKVLTRSFDPLFSYSGHVTPADPFHVLDGRGSAVTVDASRVQTVLVLKHPGCGTVEVSAAQSGLAPLRIVDLYSRIPMVGAIDLSGLSGPVSLTVAGRDRGAAAQMTVYGALLQAE